MTKTPIGILKMKSLLIPFILTFSLYANDIADSKEACQRGDMDACIHLGVAYYQGSIVPKDLTKAEHYLALACKSDSMQGCHNLAVLHQKAVPNKEHMIQEYTKACNSGMYKSCHNLANIYKKGSYGVIKDDKKALGFYKKACEGEIVSSCVYYEELVPQDFQPSSDVVTQVIEASLLRNKKYFPKQNNVSLRTIVENTNRFSQDNNFYKVKTVFKVFGSRAYYVGLRGIDMLVGVNAVINGRPDEVAARITEQYGITFEVKTGGREYVYTIDDNYKLIIMPHHWKDTSIIIAAYLGP